MTSPTPTLRPLGETLGTEVLGIDLAGALDEPTITWIQRSFAEHPVMVFRDQQPGANELATFGRVFGIPRKHSLVKYRHVDNEDVSWITNADAKGEIDWFGVRRAADWHTDSTFEDELPLLAILHAKEVPSEKGGTLFVDMGAAYARLPEQRRNQLATMTALHGRQSGPAGDRLRGGDKGTTTSNTRRSAGPRSRAIR